MKNLLRSGIAITAIFFTSMSHALLIDFTASNPWSGAAGLSSFSSGGVTLTANGGDGQLTFNSGAMEQAGCNAAGFVGLACDGDGIGIGDDVVGGFGTNLERLTITFNPVVDILNIVLLDLFTGETAFIRTTGAGFRNFNTRVGGDVNGSGGVNVVGLMTNGVRQLQFRRDGRLAANSDFSVAAIEIVAVPEPGVLALFGLGLLGLGFTRRKKRA